MRAFDSFRRLLRNEQAERRLPSLSAAVVRDGEVVWADAAGLADVEGGREATADDQYMVGSITKTFTAAAIMQLRDAGQLDLDDPLGEHVPEAAHAPTLRRMLAHLSGLQREVPGEMWESLEFPDRDQLLARFAEAEQVLKPAERWHYSNLAYALLGEVVARLSGLEYERYVEERLLGPVGLERTSWQPRRPAARGYYVEPFSEAVRPEPEVSKSAVAAAGALWSTPTDLCRWAAFLADPDTDVLAPETVEEMRGVQTLADTERWTLGFGLGLMLARDGDRVFAGHGGATIGFRAGFLWSPQERIGAAALANASTGMELDVARFFLSAALEELPPEREPWRPEEPPGPELAALLGPWWSEGEQVVFRWRDGRLEAKAAGAPATTQPSVFEPDGRDSFRVVSGPERGERLRVVRDDDGVPVKLYLATYPFTRTPQTFGSR